MNITEVRVKLMHHRTDRLRAFCSITIDDDFVVHDLRVIEGRKGFFVAMPSRKLTDNCPKCSAKNELKAKFCAECGGGLDPGRGDRLAGERDKLHVDVAHPINTVCREMLQSRVLDAYREEEGRASEDVEPSSDSSPADAGDLADDLGDVAPERVDEVHLDRVEEADELADALADDLGDVAHDLADEVHLDRAEQADELADEMPAWGRETDSELDGPELVDVAEPVSEMKPAFGEMPVAEAGSIFEPEAYAEAEPFGEAESESTPEAEPFAEPEAAAEEPAYEEPIPEEPAPEPPVEGGVRRRPRRERPSGGFGDGIL